MNAERENANQLADLLDDFRQAERITSEERDFLRLRERLQALAVEESERTALAQRSPVVKAEIRRRPWPMVAGLAALVLLAAAVILMVPRLLHGEPLLPAADKKEVIPAALVVAPQACEREEAGKELPLGYRGLGGGELQSGDFTIQMWLTCNANYSRGASSSQFYSAIDGLAVNYSWVYNGEQGRIIEDIALNIEPYWIPDEYPSGPLSITTGFQYSGADGLKLPTGVFPDWKGADARLRMALKILSSDGTIEGAALTFTLKRAADGFEPVDVAVEPLTAAEQASVQGNAVTKPPFSLIPVGEFYPELKEAEVLLARWEETLLTGGGWVHGVYQFLGTTQKGAGLERGEPDFHYWALVDPEGSTVAFAAGSWGDEGRLSAYAIYNGTSHTTEGEEISSATVPQYRGWKDVLQALIQTIEEGVSIESTYEVSDGHTILVLSYHPPLGVPIVWNGANYSEYVVRFSFDVETGAFLYISDIIFDEDGSEIEFERTVFTEESVQQPPEEILTLFEETLPSFAPTPEAGEQFHIPGAELWDGPRLAADVCSGRAMDDQPQIYERLGIGNLNGTLLGGGQLENGDFLFDAWLVCDFQFENYPNVINSEISGLAVALKWSYNGASQDGAMIVYAGMEPYIFEVGFHEPVEAGQSDVVFQGFTAPELVLPDWNLDEIPLRYAVKAELPDGSLAGVVFRLTLRREEDGFRPVDITLEPLSDFERSSPTASDVSEPPFALLDLNEVYPELMELRALLEARESALLSGAGWIHTVDQGSSDDDSLKNRLVWGNFAWDSWYQVDQQGFVLAQVMQWIATDGRLLQQSVLKDGQASNYMFVSRLNLGLTRYDFYMGLLERLLLATRFGQPAERTLESIDGREAWVFTFRENRDFPIDRGEYMVYDSVTREAIDAQNGAYLFTSTQYFDENGAPLVFDKRVRTIEERTDQAPEEILALLENPPSEYQPIPPGGTPAAPGADFSGSELALFNQPSNDEEPYRWIGDVYSGDTYLGRVDLGTAYDGWCVRSADGSKMAIRYDDSVDDAEIRSTLRWFDVNELSQVHEPAAGLAVSSRLTWSPTANELAFTACDADGLCGLYVLDAQSDEVRRLADAEPSPWDPLWKPDGSQVAVVGADEEALLVVDVKSGAEIYRGVWPWDSNWGVDFVRDWNGGNCFAEMSW